MAEIPSDSILTLSLPHAARLGVGQSMVFRFRRDGFVEQGFVLCLESGFVAYANQCPHWSVDLDLGDERFYDPQLERIYCKNHGATFLPENGLCDAGPCLGCQLERFDVKLEGESLTVRVPDAAPI